MKRRRRPVKGCTTRTQTPSTVKPVQSDPKPVQGVGARHVVGHFLPVQLTPTISKRKSMQTKRPVFIRWVGRKAKGLRHGN